MPSQQNNASNKSLIAKLMFVSALLFFLIFPLVVEALTIFEDTFEEYDLGDLRNQGDWVLQEGEAKIQVIDSEYVQGSQSISIPAYSAGYADKRAGSSVCVGSLGFWFKVRNSDGVLDNVFYFTLWKSATGKKTSQIRLNQTGKDVQYLINSTKYVLGQYQENVWHAIDIEWDCNVREQRISFDGGEWTAWVQNMDNTFDEPNEIVIQYANAGEPTDFYVDYISETSGIPAEEIRLWGISPDSETEITDLDTTFTFGYEGLADYDGVLISFYNQTTRIHTNALRFETDILGDEGEKEVNLQDFYFEKNANWYFHAIGFWEQPETYEGLYLTGRYITEYTYDIVSPKYFLTINIEGFITIFEMEDWETWYGEHAEQFETPTLLFGRVATLFAPTFQNIGEFGQRILDYFEVDKAYSRGYELGLAIPIFNFYLTEIEVFFGGLPVMKLFLMTLILMVGIFLFKIVMKFIPFFG